MEYLINEYQFGFVSTGNQKKKDWVTNQPSETEKIRMLIVDYRKTNSECEDTTLKEILERGKP